MQPVVRRPPAKRCALLVPWPSLAPAVGNSRGCAEQFAHAPSRRRAVCVGRRVTRGAACGASAARKAVRPVGSLAQPRTCGGQFARAAPGTTRTRRPGAGLFVSTGASPAVRPVVRRLPAKRCAPLVPWPSLARTRLVPGACPRRASVSRGSNWASVSSGPRTVCVCALARRCGLSLFYQTAAGL